MTPLSLNEIRARLFHFSETWKDAKDEKADAKSFWDALFSCYGANRRQIAKFEAKITKLDGNPGFIDLLWKGKLVVEHKSKDKDLSKAREQAEDYIERLKPAERPRYLVTSDFARFEVSDLFTGKETKFNLEDLAENAEVLSFIAGYEPKRPSEEAPVNIAAVERLGELYDTMKEVGYPDHDLQVFLVRILFCLFAEDTGVFEPDVFTDFILNRTADDGSNLGAQLNYCFEVLNCEPKRRQSTLDEMLSTLPYVNGELFADRLAVASMNTNMRNSLLRCSEFDWSKISPAIFGSLFQGVMGVAERRATGAHYTSEENILKLIRPLFLDALRTEFTAIKNGPSRGRVNKYHAFHEKIAKMRVFDPACGCGNFLILSYRELRKLEIDLLKELHPSRQQVTDVALLSRLNVDQFYGIEIDEFPAQIAKVALWLMDHVMNVELGYAFGQTFTRLPLIKSANIINDNALRINWEDIISPEDCSYIIGNPPFIGKHLLTPAQSDDIRHVCGNINGSGVLDLVSAWYIKAAAYIKGSLIDCAFVSTNSITQGEQVGILWNHLFHNYKIKIVFAHRTFAWKSEARGKAHVHVVIIGFANTAKGPRPLWDYHDIKADPVLTYVSNISPYLMEGKDFALNASRNPICPVPKAIYGSKPTDGGALIIEDEEVDIFLNQFPHAAPFVKPLLCTSEYLNNGKRWCLWLQNAKPKNILLPGIKERVLACRKFRLKSVKSQTREKASEAHLFAEIRQPHQRFIVIPQHSSKTRTYIPFGFFSADYIVHNSCTIIPDPSLYQFGIISSLMHMEWVRVVCGRIKSDYRYSGTLVYNNFPWPTVTQGQRTSVSVKAEAIINARDKYPESSLAELYNPLAMPTELCKAHRALDRAVDRAYRKQPFQTVRERIEFLFALHESITVPLVASTPTKRRRGATGEKKS